MKSKPLELFIGIDICKDRLDVADDSESSPWSVANDDSGISSLVDRLSHAEGKAAIAC